MTSVPSSTNDTSTVCQNCQTSTTPLWRRDESGQVLCNACGLFLKLHGRRRPISLKTDVIKSRNRSRTHTNQMKTKRPVPQTHHLAVPQVMPHPLAHQVHPPPYPELPPIHHVPPHVPSTPSTMFYPNSPTLQPYSQPRPNYTSASVTNSPRIQPPQQQQQQHGGGPPPPPPPPPSQPQMVLPPPRQIQSSGNSPALPPTQSPRLPSLSTLNKSQTRPPSPRREHTTRSEQLRPRSPAENVPEMKGEKSRVSELEIVNDLLRSRITQLEQNESNARKELDQARAKIVDLEQQLGKRQEDRPKEEVKRIKVSDII